MIDLQSFCAHKHHHDEKLRAPFQHGACVYATNGHMAVRIPRDEAPHVGIVVGTPSNIGDMFDEWFDEQKGEFTPLPKPAMLSADRRCEECQGTGAHDYGDGSEQCWGCGGTGFVGTPTAIGDAHFNLHYLHMMAALPNARIRTHGPTGCAAILFDGGQALLMPVRM